MSQINTTINGVLRYINTDIGGPVKPTSQGIITLHGGNNITTDGSVPNTVTINLTGTTNHAVQVGNITGSLDSLPLALSGQGLMGLTGFDPFFTGSPDFNGTVTAGTGFVATTDDVSIVDGSLLLPTTTALIGQIQINNIPVFHAYGSENIFVGVASGNFTLTGDQNTATGPFSLNSLTSGEFNSAYGYQSLYSCTSGIANSSYGYKSMKFLTTGAANSVFGSAGLAHLVSGSYNVGLGEGGSLWSVGDNYIGAESSNILIQNEGVTGESNTIRIGTQGSGNGQQASCFVAGIYNTSTGSATATVVIADSNGQLGAPGVGNPGDVLTMSATEPVWSPLAPSGITWTREVGDTVSLVVDHGYINTNVAQTVYTLPVSAALGTVIAIVGESAGGWQIQQNAGQSIQLGFVSTAVGLGGGLASTNQYDVVYLMCRVVDSTWSVFSSMGNILIA